MKRPLLAFCVLVVCLIAMWQAFFPPDLPDLGMAGERVWLYGRVVSKEHRTGSGQPKSILYLSDFLLFSNAPTISGGDFSKKTTEKESYSMAGDKRVMVTLREDFLPKIGQYVLVAGVIADFDRAKNPGEFDSKLYYAGQGICLQMFEGDVQVQGSNYNRFLEHLWQIKERCKSILTEKLGQRQGSVLATILLGSKESLDAEMKSLYQQSGISHILAISGLHISLVGMGIYKLLRRLYVPVWLAALIGIAGVILFGIFTDAGASAYRAAGMFIIRMLGIMLKRSYDMLTSLGVLMALMVLQNPLYLYDVGFWLSFGAMVGIGCIYPLLLGTGKTRRYREGLAKLCYKTWRAVKESVLLSFSVTVVTLPIMCLSFYELSPYSILLNLLILPFLPMLFVFGFLLIVASAWEVSTIFCVLTELVLNGYSALADWSLRLPCSRVVVGGVNAYQVLFYVMVLGILILCGKRISRQGCYKLLFIAIVSMTVRVNFGAEICFLDVGQGDGIFMRTAAGTCYFIDGGSSSQKEIGKYTLAPFLKKNGVRQIEAWIVTHPDADHCNGINDVLANGYGNRVKRILMPAVADEYMDEDYLSIVMLAAEYEIPVYYLSAGVGWKEDDASFLCLNPPAPAQREGMSSNEYSLVFHLELGERSFLLTGDVEGDGEEHLVKELKERGICHVDVLKVAHHGSRNSTSEAFLEALDADVAVISCGERNAYGHPHRETLERLSEDGSKVCRTDHSGAITMNAKKG